jgi:hypothetical protein
MAKPSSHLEWCVGNPDPATNVIEPTGAKKITGWAKDERPPYEFMNWLFSQQDLWNKYFEGKTDVLEARADVVIGTSARATHATLQAAVDDVSLGGNLWVLIEDDYTIDTTIQLSKTGWRIDFLPGVVYSKGTATTGIQMAAEGIQIRWGKFSGWTAGGDIAIEQNASGVYCSVWATRFGVGTDTEVDQSLVPAGKKGPVSDTITEV